MKKIVRRLLSFGICAAMCGGILSLFSACQSGETDLNAREVQASYSNGRVTFQLNVKGVKSFDVYRSESPDGEKVKVDSCKNEYQTDDAYGYYSFYPKGEEENGTEPYSYIRSTFGNENVKVFTPDDDPTEIQNFIDLKYNRMLWDEFSEDRTAIFFMPGKYESITAKVGFYTTVSGLDYSPENVELKGFRTEECPIASGSLVNFWRSAENFTVNEDALWCVSQATSLRRMNFKGNLALDDGGFASGGFLADSKVAGNVTNSTQQQWLTRNAEIGAWTKSDINMVFSGVTGDIPDSWPNPRNTILEKTNVMREKPFIVFDEQKGYGVFVPELRKDAVGVSWGNGTTAGEFIGLDDFYIAYPVDTAQTLNKVLATGKSIIFTPGVYNITEPLEVNTENTVILGMGMATLRTVSGNTDTCMRVGDVNGVKIGGILFDAGTVTDSLLELGENGCERDHSENPTSLSDCFFRLGGSGQYDEETGTLTSVSVSVDKTLIINSGDVIGDNFWLWRADHGMDWKMLEEYVNEDGTLREDTSVATNWQYWKSYCVGWKTAENNNYGANGLIVNGDRVTIYGLMVEHYGEYQTIWNGENGFMCFYQSETPYDAPNQESWMRNGGAAQSDQGWASYKVGDDVQNHTAYGIGIYFVLDDGLPARVMDHAVEAPSNAGIALYHMVTANFKSVAGGGIRYICNQYGSGNIAPYTQQKVAMTSFVAGKAVI